MLVPINSIVIFSKFLLISAQFIVLNVSNKGSLFLLGYLIC